MTHYRFHLEAPVRFHKSIRATIEDGHANLRSDNFDGVLQGADAHALVDLLCLHPRVPVYCGVEDLHYVAFILGAHGSVSDLGSVFPGELSEIYRSCRSGKHEDARLHHERLVRLWRILSPAAERESRVRSALAAQGREVGVARSPYNFLGSGISHAIKAAIQEEGLIGTRPD